MTDTTSATPRFPGAGGEPDGKARIDALNERAWETRHTDPTSALWFARQALELANRAGYRVGAAYALRNSGACRCLLLDFELALADLGRAMEIFGEIGEPAGSASALNWTGNVHHRRSDFPASLASHFAALGLQRSAGDRTGEAATMIGIGNVHFAIGEFARALEAYQAALRLAEETGDRVRVAQSVVNIGNIHGELADFRRALEFHGRALALAREVGDLNNEAVSLLNMGVSHSRLGEHEHALRRFHEALAVAQDVGDRHAEARAFGELGLLHGRRGERDAALESCSAAIEATLATGSRYLEAVTRTTMGELFLLLAEPERAREALGEALAIGEEIRARGVVCEAHVVLSRAHEVCGDAARALHHLKSHYEVREETRNAETERRIQTLLVQAEVERSQREAELLRTMNDELTAANDALRAADREKASLLEQLRLQAAELERQSREDGLTGLANRRWTDECLAVEWERASRFGEDLTVVIADIDHFKSINDRFSHASGDDVLRRVARILRASCRTIDVVGRYGGEEFLLLLPRTPPEQARGLCERIRAAVEASDWATLHPELRVTLSMGVCGSGGSAEALVRGADARLYEAKHAGRNRVCG